MTRAVLGAFAFATVITLVASTMATAQADTISIRSGPDLGEIRVSTPWGDYVAYDEGGGQYWVGTQKEYDRSRVIGIMQGDNFRLSTVQTDAGATAEFVDASTYRTRVGDVPIDGIAPEIAFNDPVAGYGPSAAHSLSVTWIQSSPVLVTCFVFDKKEHYVYVPSPLNINHEFRNVAFGLPNDLFKRPLVLIFVAHNRRPGFVGVSSVAQDDYIYLKGRSPEQNTPQDELELKRLLSFDPSLRSYAGTKNDAGSSAQSNARAPRPSPTPTPYDIAAAHPIRTYDFAGPIHDGVAGDGTIELHLKDNGYGAITGGTWDATFSNATYNNQGTVVGNPASGFAFYLESRGCPYVVGAKPTADGGYSAKYRGIECNNGGTFTVSLVISPGAAQPPATPVNQGEPSPMGHPPVNAAAPQTPRSNEQSQNGTYTVRMTTARTATFKTPSGITVHLTLAPVSANKITFAGRPRLSSHHGLLYIFSDSGAYHLFSGNNTPSLDIIAISANGEVNGVLSLRGMPAESQGVSEVGVPTGSASALQSKFAIILPEGEAAGDGITNGAVIFVFTPAGKIIQ